MNSIVSSVSLASAVAVPSLTLTAAEIPGDAELMVLAQEALALSKQYHEVSAKDGLDVAEGQADELFDQLRKIERKIEKMRAVTLDGFRAKAEVIAHVCWGGKIDRDHDTTDLRIMASLLSDLTGLPDEERPTESEDDAEA
jgi:hypothetical protein